MPTARSWTEGLLREQARAVADVGTLLRFRAAHVRRPRAFRVGLLVFALATAAIAVVPAYLPGAGGPGRAQDVLLLLPTALAGLVLGLIAMNDTKRSGQSGHSLAVAAVIISSLAIVGYFVYVLVFAMVSGPSTG